MPTTRPRRNRRTTSKRGVRKPRVSFNTRVLQALQKTAERKTTKLSNLANPMNMAITSSNVYELMPNITQGVRAHGSRIGNEIMLKKLTIKGYMVIPASQQITGSNGTFLGRLMVLRSRNHSGSAIVNSPTTLFQFNDLMEYDQPYTGQPNNWLQKPNANLFVSRRDKRFKFSTSTNHQGTQPDAPNPDTIKFFTMTLTFGKQGKKLQFTDDTSTSTNNFPYFMVAAIHTADGAAVTGSPLLNYYTEATYTDV